MIKKHRLINIHYCRTYVFSASKPCCVTVLIELTVCMQHVNGHFSNVHYAMPYAANDLSVLLKCNKYSEQHSQSVISVTWVETPHWAKIRNLPCIIVNMKRRLFSVVTLEPERNKQFLIKSLKQLYILIVRYIYSLLYE